MSNKYEYLFPFEKIPRGKKILIYGAGDVGLEYLQQILMTQYCNVIGFVDRRWESCPEMVVAIYAPKDIVSLDYDYIVIAMKTSIHINDIMSMLIKEGIDRSKIIYQSTRHLKKMYVDSSSASVSNSSFAFFDTPVSIALKFGNGLGDCIIQKPLVEQLINLIPKCRIDIYTPMVKNIRSIYSDMPNIANVINDAGLLYVKNCKKYMLALEVFYLLKIYNFNYEVAKNYSPKVAAILNLLKDRCTSYDLDAFPATRARVHLERVLYNGGDIYSLYNYTGVFHGKNERVNIPLTLNGKNEFLKLKLDKYITIHTGSGVAKKNHEEFDARQWPQAYYQEFVEKFKERYPDVAIVQIGDQNTKKLLNVDKYVFDKSIEIVKYVLKNTIFHLSTEGGLMHLATQLGAKCVTIFGQTQVKLLGYKQNINILTSGCNGCASLYDNPFACARGLEKPKCMYDIKANLVMEKVEKYMITVLMQ